MVHYRLAFRLVFNKLSKRTIRPLQLLQHKRLFGCLTQMPLAASPAISASFFLFGVVIIADRAASYFAAAAARGLTCTRIHPRY